MHLISTADLQQKLTTNPPTFFLFDVRSVEEYDSGHIPTAILAPWENILEKMNGIKKDRELILYCNTNVRSHKAAEMLRKAGYGNVIVYKQGWEGWIREESWN